MQPFDIFETPLRGTNLIEAGAGAGKTHAIAGLYARLLLEENLSVDQILVVTYTQAASEELKGRIRRLIYDLRRACEGKSTDPLWDHLQKRLDPRVAKLRLNIALADFDRAAINTIHGFCQKILSKYAFESGQCFESELIHDQRSLLIETADDFWRSRISHTPIELAAYIVDNLKNPDALVKEFKRCPFPGVRIWPTMKKPVLRAIRPWRESAGQVLSAWPLVRDRVIALISAATLNATSYRSTEVDPQRGISPREELIDAMSMTLDVWNGDYPLPPHFHRWTRNVLHKAAKKKSVPPTDPFFDLCQQAFDAQSDLEIQLAAYLRYLKVKFLSEAPAKLSAKKQRRNQLHFDDLIIRLHTALHGEDADGLIHKIRTQFRAALIDEFQDTDPLQYDIFTRLFIANQAVLFMIGDPKQAIYSFRGADVYAYLHAARNAPQRYSLTQNYRSTPALIRAVNTIFQSRIDPFGIDGIRFESAQPAQACAPDDAPGVFLWHLPLKEEAVTSAAINSEDAVKMIAGATAGEIAELLANSSAEARPEEIAVLTRTHRQAQLVKTELSRRNVPAVLHSTGRIFDADEAFQMHLLLLGIWESSNPTRVRSALVTPIMGVKLEDFVGPDGGQENAPWTERWPAFAEYRQEWLSYGFYKMFRVIMHREDVAPRLLGLEFGERRLTNVLHLAELLHQAESKKHLRPSQLIQWLADQRESEDEGDETQQLRLESDARAVQIITMHRSKGLQFDIVFCPFTWTWMGQTKNSVVFHDPRENYRLTLAVGPEVPAEFLSQSRKEEFSENLRMLYVALTRARRRCYWVWGRIRNAELSAPAYLLHGSDINGAQTWDERVASRLTQITDAAMLKDLRALSSRSQGSIALLPMPCSSAVLPISGAEPSLDKGESPQIGTLELSFNRAWRVTSFSALTAETDTDEQDWDDDRIDALVEDPLTAAPGATAYDTLDNFPGGSRAGLFFHDLLEHIPFAKSESERQKVVIARKLGDHGYDSDWSPAIARMIDDLGSFQLPGGEDLRLDLLPAQNRVNEMEFYFPLKHITHAQLSQVLGRATEKVLPGSRRAMERLTFAPVEGFLKGYIDMVFTHRDRFYLVDWKSNDLRRQGRDYGTESLRKVMTESFYFLQYHLYTLALHLYLKYRLADYTYAGHFGGVLYIFLRGVEEGKGIYFDRPQESLIVELEQLLIDK